MPRIYEGVVGMSIYINMNEDISEATNIVLHVLKPDGSTTEWTPSIYSANKLLYTIQSMDLDIPGIYRIQPELTLGLWSGFADTVQIDVLSKFS